MLKVKIHKNASVNKQLFIENELGTDSGGEYLDVEDQNLSNLIDFATGPSVRGIMVISANPKDLSNLYEIVPLPSGPRSGDRQQICLNKYLDCMTR